MMDHYQTLGINETASQDEIRSAYKKLAMKNHPDRGGDTKKFQEISQAYDILSDPQKKAQYDAEKNGFNTFGGGFANMQDMFGFKFGPGFASFTTQSLRRNKDLTIRISITLKQSYTGTQIEARYSTPSGKKQTVVVDIPAGIMNGQTVRYGHLGDDTHPNLPRGNLNVQVMIDPDPVFERINNDLHTTLSLNLYEAMAGCQKEITHLDGVKIPITIRPGVCNGTEFCANGRGFKDMNTGRPGNLFIRLDVPMPAITDPILLDELRTFYDKVSKIT